MIIMGELVSNQGGNGMSKLRLFLIGLIVVAVAVFLISWLFHYLSFILGIIIGLSIAILCFSLFFTRRK